MTKINLQLKRLIDPIDKVSYATSDEHLGTILGLTTSSHEPVFIFDKENNFLGLISATSALFERNYPYSTKVESEVTVPPHISSSSTIDNVINHMLSTRFYTLPVFDHNQKILGAIRTTKIFKSLLKHPKLFKKIATKLKISSPVTINADKKVKDAYKLLRQKKISRLLVVDKEGKLTGIISRNDLKNAFTSPSSRQRFSKSSGDFGQAMFDEEEVKRSDLPLANYTRTDVSTIKDDSSKNEVIKKLIKSQHNSIVLIDKNNKPTGIISNRDILLAFSNLNNEIDIPIIMEKPKDISAFFVEEIENKIIEMGAKLNRIIPVQRFEVTFNEIKNGIGRPNIIETTLKAKFYTGDDFIAKYQNHELLVGVRETLDRIHKMVRRKVEKRKGRDKNLKLD